MPDSTSANNIAEAIKSIIAENDERSERIIASAINMYNFTLDQLRGNRRLYNSDDAAKLLNICIMLLSATDVEPPQTRVIRPGEVVKVDG